MPKPLYKNKLAKKSFIVEWKKLKQGQKIFIIFLAGISLFFCVRFVWAQIDKYKFEQERKAIAQIYGRIPTEVGEPAYKELKSSCAYSSTKFSKGILRCGSQTIALYKVNDHLEANNLKIKLITLLRSSSYEVTQELTSTNTSNINKVDFQSIDSLTVRQNVYIAVKHKKTHRYCEPEFEFGDSSKVSNIEQKVAGLNMSLYFGCFDEAKFEHYPVK